jgi:hypothetical protein
LFVAIAVQRCCARDCGELPCTLHWFVVVFLAEMSVKSLTGPDVR